MLSELDANNTYISIRGFAMHSVHYLQVCLDLIYDWENVLLTHKVSPPITIIGSGCVMKWWVVIEQWRHSVLGVSHLYIIWDVEHQSRMASPVSGIYGEIVYVRCTQVDNTS